MGDGAMPRLLTFSLGGNKRASDTCFTDDAVVQQALAHPSSARVAAAKELGASAWNYLGGNSCNTLAGNGFGCSTGFGNAFGSLCHRQAALHHYRA